MNAQEIYITANPTPNPNALKFIVDRQLVDGAPVSYETTEAAAGSPLAEKLFQLPAVSQIFAYQNFVTVTRQSGMTETWQEFAREIGKVIRTHLQESPGANFAPPQHEGEGKDDEKIAIIKSVLDEIRPMVAMDGGNIVFAGYQSGVVQLYMQGSCSGCPSASLTLKSGIESRLKEVLPEVSEVVAI